MGRADDRAAVSRAEAVDAAARALRHRDLSRVELDRRLERRGIPEVDREAALAALGRAGLVDDGRTAAARADALAGRGYGDLAIRHDLEQRGYAADAVEAALEALPDEVQRAQALVARRGATLATARRLAGRGFAADVIEAVLGRAVAEDAGGALP